MTSTNPADDQCICPECKKPILSGEEAWHTTQGMKHGRCLPKKTLEEYREKWAKLQNESQGSTVASVRSILRGPVKLSKPEDFAPAEWKCRKCRDTGMRETEPDEQGYVRAFECECARRRRAEARVRALENSQRRFKGLTFTEALPRLRQELAAHGRERSPALWAPRRREVVSDQVHRGRGREESGDGDRMV